MGNKHNSHFDLTFDETVEVTEYFYPPITSPNTFTKLFSDLGGSMGLWLGLGLLQLCFNVINSVKYIITRIFNS